MYILNNSEALKQVTLVAGAGGVAHGDLVALSSGTIIKATAVATTIFGVAQEDALEGGTVSVALVEGYTIEADYTGTFSASDIGKAFDLSDAQTVDQTATVQGDMILVGYNANTNKGQFIVPLAKRAI